MAVVVELLPLTPSGNVFAVSDVAVDGLTIDIAGEGRPAVSPDRDFISPGHRCLVAILAGPATVVLRAHGEVVATGVFEAPPLRSRARADRSRRYGSPW